MAKPLQWRKMSAVTMSVSVSCLPVSGMTRISIESKCRNLYITNIRTQRRRGRWCEDFMLIFLPDTNQ